MTRHESGDDDDAPLLGLLLRRPPFPEPLFSSAQEAVEEFDKVAECLRDHKARRARPGLASGYLSALGEAYFRSLPYRAEVEQAVLRVLVALGELAELDLKQIEAKKRRSTATQTPRTPPARTSTAEGLSRFALSYPFTLGGPSAPEMLL
jgi:hypothetical protein